MKLLPPSVPCALLGLLLPISVHSANDFHGLVDNRPANVAGTWVIGGRELQVSAKTRLVQDQGPIQVGTCVAVDLKQGQVEEIESQKPDQCLPQ